MINDHILSRVNPESLSSYLANNGWKNESPTNADLFKYTNKVGAILILPASSQAPRYSKSVTNVLETLADWEERSVKEIFQSIVNPSTDTLVFSFKGQEADKGSLSLGYLHQVIGNLKDTIAYSACSEWQPRPFFDRRTKRSLEMSEKAKFGQTDLGSYVINISLAHSRSSAQKEPIERKVFKRIITSLTQVREEVTGVRQIDVNTDYKTGINANLAESLSQLNRTGISLNVKATWDAVIPVDDVFKKTIPIEERMFEVLDSVSVQFRGEEAAKDSVSILKAKVVSLTKDSSNEDDNDFDEDNYIILKVIDPERFPVSKVRVSLDTEDYRKACRAHLEGQEVSINGELGKDKNRWWLLKYENFTISQNQ